ncbi:MAG TPA: AMP-binding protein, partial [Nocardioides sp.]
MSLTDYLDKGASLGRDAPCLTLDERTLSYRDVQDLSHSVARALRRSGVRPGDKVGILSANDPVAFAAVFGIARRGAVWCPINPRNEAAENRELLDLFDCVCLIFQSAFAPLVRQIAAQLPKLTVLVCLDQDSPQVPSLQRWLAEAGDPGGDEPDDEPGDEPGDVPGTAAPHDDIVMIVGTGGTTGRPKGVMLTDRNIETMSALTLIGYPFTGRPVYLALAPLTHAAGVLCFPILALGGQVIVMARPDLTQFLALIARHRVTHTFLPPTLIYMLLAHQDLAGTDLGSLQCFWYGAAPMSAARLEEAIATIGPVMAQLFGQSEAPMMISTMAPQDHLNPDGSVAR